MKRVVLWMVLATFFLSGCAGMGSGCKSFQSDTLALNRVVTLYSCDGSIIEQYSGKMRVGDTNKGGGMYVDVFTDNGVKRNFIGGTYTIKEQ